MEFQDVVLRRRMVRDFSAEPVARPLVEQLVANATSIPSAGYSQGFAFVVLTDPGQRRLFWETTSGPEWRGESESEALTRAPVVILPLAHKQAYLDRYALPDKVHTPLSGEEHWPAPYWDIDTGFGVMLILLTAVELGLGALFFADIPGPDCAHGRPGCARGLSTHRRHRSGVSDRRRALRARASDRPPPPRGGREVGALVIGPALSGGLIRRLAGVHSGRPVDGVDDGHVGDGVGGWGEERLAFLDRGSECFELVAVGRTAADPLVAPAP